MSQLLLNSSPIRLHKNVSLNHEKTFVSYNKIPNWNYKNYTAIFYVFWKYV